MSIRLQSAKLLMTTARVFPRRIWKVDVWCFWDHFWIRRRERKGQSLGFYSGEYVVVVLMIIIMTKRKKQEQEQKIKEKKILTYLTNRSMIIPQFE